MPDATHSTPEQVKTGQANTVVPISGKSEEKLDDIMLAMDVVDTLRHEHIMVKKDLAVEDRRQNLVARLRGIYDAQGIDVPDSVLLDGVMALEEKRFAYTPPKKGFGLKLASLYIRRKTWLPLIYMLSFILGSATLINYVGFVRPAAQSEARVERLLTKTLPSALSDARDRAVSVAATPELKNQAEILYQSGQSLIKEADAKGAETVSKRLTKFAQDLEQNYTVQIVSRPNEYSGVFRVNDDVGAENVRNYYLIVEAIDPLGKILTVNINSEEDRATDRVTQWGIRVPEDVFNVVAADKKDDRIIQNAIIGTKKRGFLEPDYKIKVSGGKILDW